MYVCMYACQGICSRLSWSLSLSDLSTTRIKGNVESVATYFLKRWCHLAKPGNVSHLYLPFKSGGLQLPSLVTSFKRCQVSKYHQLLNSEDVRVKILAEKKSDAFSHNKTRKFNPFHYINQSRILTSGESSASRRLSKAKQLAQLAEDSNRLDHGRSCVQQGSTLRLPQSENADLWSKTVMSLSDRVFSFCLNAIQDTLPTRSNPYWWGKCESHSCLLCGEYQSLQHVLNHWPVVLTGNRFTWRHNSILYQIYTFL